MISPAASKILPQVCVLDLDGHTLAMLKRMWQRPSFPRSACPREGVGRETSPMDWRTATQTTMLTCQIQSAVDIDELLSFTSTTFGSIGIVDFGPDEISDRAIHVLSHMQQTMDLVRRSKLIVVGSRWIGSFERELQLSGFAMAIRSKSEYERIVVVCQRYWQALNWPEMKIEQRVAGSLPWNPVD